MSKGAPGTARDGISGHGMRPGWNLVGAATAFLALGLLLAGLNHHATYIAKPDSDRGRLGNAQDVLVVVSPSPLPDAQSVTLRLETVGGLGVARFSGGSAALAITGTRTVRILGVTNSSSPLTALGP